MASHPAFCLDSSKKAQISILVRREQRAFLVIIATPRQLQVDEQIIQRERRPQGIDQDRFLPVGEALRINAQVFFKSSAAPFQTATFILWNLASVSRAAIFSFKEPISPRRLF